MKTAKLFEGIAEDERKALLNCLSAREQTFRKNDFVFTAGISKPAAGMVVKGSLQIIKEDYWGNRTIIESVVQGELFGEAFACAEVDSVPVSVVAAEETVILLMDYQKLFTTCSSSCRFHSRIIRNMTKILAQKNMALMQKMEHITKRTTREKLLSYLSVQALFHESNDFIIPFNRQELADYLSVDRSAMSAELAKMRDEGLIRFQKNHFTLFS